LATLYRASNLAQNRAVSAFLRFTHADIAPYTKNGSKVRLRAIS
jgi:hypothetical protein